jgi:dTDP-4-amino-4,6-dideoxygalactose transaminase
MTDPFRVVRDFEAALCEYTGAPYAVTATSCTMALLLAVAYHINRIGSHGPVDRHSGRALIEIPKRTYIGVPYAINEAGGRTVFREENWLGVYRLKPLAVWDCARWFTKDLYHKVAWPNGCFTNDRPQTASGMVCVSFHWSKTLGIQQGGAILHNNAAADAWFRRARFDGRSEGVPPSQDNFMLERAWHAYMSPEIAAEGLVRLSNLPRDNTPLPNDDYPDLSEMECFR